MLQLLSEFNANRCYTDSDSLALLFATKEIYQSLHRAAQLHREGEEKIIIPCFSKSSQHSNHIFQYQAAKKGAYSSSLIFIKTRHCRHKKFTQVQKLIGQIHGASSEKHLSQTHQT